LQTSRREQGSSGMRFLAGVRQSVMALYLTYGKAMVPGLS
jgi:hypothetical protein